MKVIVSSRYAVEVVDLESGEKHLVRTASYETLYYGITWYQDCMYIARRDLSCGTCVLEVLDSNLEYIDTISFGTEVFQDLHQIVEWDNKLWVTSSGNNTIVVLNAANPREVIDIWGPNKDWIGSDRNHFNSIWFHEDFVHLVAHNHGGSQLWMFTYPDRDLIDVKDLGVGAHNVLIFGDVGARTVLCSGTGHVMLVDGNKVKLPVNKYPRGIAYDTNGFAVIGRSEHVSDREDRYKERLGAVQEYRVRPITLEFTLLRTVELHHGMVFEVRGLDFHDHAHNGALWRGKYGIAI